MQSDGELIERTLKGGDHYYGILIQRYADYVFGLCMRLTGGNRASAEDISQQSFLKSYKYLKAYDSKQDYKHWLTGITVNCFKDLRRQENRYESLDEGAEPTFYPELHGNKDFFLLIKPLSAEEKILVVLKYLYDYQNADIAAFLGMKLGTVKSKLSRALDKLR